MTTQVIAVQAQGWRGRPDSAQCADFLCVRHVAERVGHARFQRQRGIAVLRSGEVRALQQAGID